MKVLGALESAQIEWFTDAGKPAASSYPYRVIYVTDLKQIQVSDGTNWNPSAVYSYTASTLPAAASSNNNQIAFITDTLQVKVSNGTKWVTIGARLDTYTSSTLPSASSNSNQIVWVSDLQQVQVSNGSAWIQVGSKAGTKNYFSQNNANPDFETNSTSPWSACTLTFSSGAPSGAPTLTATQMAISTTSTNPLAGTYSMLLTKSAANAQYQGFISGALTIDREDTAKVLYGSFNYEVTSGTVDFSGASTQTYEIWVYNTVSGVWTQPAGYRGMNQSSGSGKVVFSFQTDGTTANNSYKIAVITQQTGTGAIVVAFDDFQLGPESIVLGTPVTDWQSYTPTFTGFGTASGVSFFYRRVGDSIEINGYFTTGTTTATEARISLPSGLTSADSTKISTLQIVGSWARDSFASTVNNWAILAEQSKTYFTLGVGDTSSRAGLAKAIGTSFSSSSLMSLNAKIAIQGWSSNVQTSDTTDTRVVACIVTGDPASATSGNPIIVPTVQNDTHGAYSTSTGKYTVPVTGFYMMFGSLQSASTATTLTIYKNAVSTQLAGSLDSNGEATFSGMVYCLSGDLIDIRPGGTVDATNMALNIKRLSGPSVITATETIAAKYNNTAGTSITGGVAGLVPFATKDYDTHNAFASNTYTIPVSGKYIITSLVTGTTTSTGISIRIKVDGTDVAIGRGYNTTAGPVALISAILNLNAGQAITIYADASTTQNLATFAGGNYFSIVRVGN